MEKWRASSRWKLKEKDTLEVSKIDCIMVKEDSSMTTDLFKESSMKENWSTLIIKPATKEKLKNSLSSKIRWLNFQTKSHLSILKKCQEKEKK